MAMYKKALKWRRWHGSPVELASFARQATELLRGRDTADEGYRASITVVLPTLETTYDSPEDFERETLPGDLPRIEAIRVSTESPDEDRAVVLSVSRSAPALSLDVRGTDRKEVEGIAEVLRESLNRGRRVPERFFTLVGVATSVAFVAVWLGIIFLWRDAPWWLGAFGGVAGIAWAVPALILNKLVPTLELIPNGTNTRWARSRRWLVRTALAAAGSAVAAGLLAVVKLVLN